MTRACVIGWPIEHSRSPIIHGYWLRTYGIDGSYTREPVRPEELQTFLASLGERGFAGCNVTVPHKEAALALADVPDAAAVAIGAANTLWLQDGRLCASNTDAYGFMTYLGLKAPEWTSRDAPVLILGAGGAARAIMHGFLQADVARVRVCNRSRERSEDLVRHFGSRVEAWDWDARNDAAREAGVIVNTTTLGMKGAGDPGIDFAGVHADTVVSDIVYVPLETAFLAAARGRGLRTVDGLGMLLHQAVPGFEKWFGVRPEVSDALYDLVRADIERPV
ncbi:MAG: shikimate dehydrogenase [Hyphomicrobium sp.]|nr:shikimate dehydrogenase [Hyphomicrobium sp.]PPD07944.1 MAG: shikimate dehydrogenase [Hyphomicrobium sp.]